MREKRQPITYAERFLLQSLERFLRSLQRPRFVGDALELGRPAHLREGKTPLGLFQAELLFQFTERDKNHRLVFPIVSFEQSRQHEILRLPKFAGAIAVTGAPSDFDQRLTGECIERFATTLVLNCEETELLEIE